MRRKMNGTVRPYRLFDTQGGKDGEGGYIPSRCYKTAHNAHDRAWDVMNGFFDPKHVVVLENIETHKALVQYTLHIDNAGKFSLTWEEV